MDALHLLLAAAKKQKTIVQVSYMGGETPGRERYLYVKSANRKNEQFVAIEDGRDNKERTYSYRKVYWVLVPETGERAENPDAIGYLDLHNAREKRKIELAVAIEADRSSNAVTTVPGVTQISDSMYRVQIGSLNIQVEAPSLLAINFFANQLRRTAHKYVGGIWQLIDVIVECEINWHAWQTYLLHANRIGAKARGDRPTLREAYEGRKKIPVEEYWKQNALYESLDVYRPDDISDAMFFELERAGFFRWSMLGCDYFPWILDVHTSKQLRKLCKLLALSHAHSQSKTRASWKDMGFFWLQPNRTGMPRGEAKSCRLLDLVGSNFKHSGSN